MLVFKQVTCYLFSILICPSQVCLCLWKQRFTCPFYEVKNSKFCHIFNQLSINFLCNSDKAYLYWFLELYSHSMNMPQIYSFPHDGLFSLEKLPLKYMSSLDVFHLLEFHHLHWLARAPYLFLSNPALCKSTQERLEYLPINKCSGQQNILVYLVLLLKI